PQRRPLVLVERVEEEAPDGRAVLAHRSEEGPPPPGGEADPGAPRIGLAVAPLDELARLHPAHLMRDAALLPAHELGELGGPQPAALRLGEGQQDAVVGLRDAGVPLELAVEL